MIKFESEKCFENMLFEHLRETMVDPMHGEKIIFGQQQPNFGAHGVGDIILLTEFVTNGQQKTVFKHAHLIELKIQPLIASHIAQVCRYKDFFERSDFARRAGLSDIRYSLINCYSDISYDMQCLAESCGVDIYYYTMSMSGIDFSGYDVDIDESMIKGCSEKLIANIPVDNGDK